MANRFLNNITINDSYTLPSADGTANQVIATDGNGNLSFTDVTASSADTASLADKALSLTITVKNTESVALTKGQVVCAAPSATPPSGNVIEVKLADNNGTDSMPAIGVLNEGLDAAGGTNDEGEAIMFGRISGINTSAFSVGDEVFVSDTPGALTATKPTGVKYIQKIGVVMRDDASNGTIEVFGAGRTNDVPTPLYIDHANQRVGIGVASPQSKLHVDGKILATWGEFTTTVNQDPGADDLNVSGFGIQGNRTSNPVYVHNYGNGGVRISSNSTLGQVNGMLVTDTSVDIAGDLVVSGGDITLGGTGRIQGVDTVSASTDAVNKAYVDNGLAGKLSTTGKAADSNLLDGIDSGSFLRSDAADTATGTISFAAGVNIVANPLRFQRNSTSQTGQDDNVSVTVDDSNIYFTHNNDDDGDASGFNFRYSTAGTTANLLNFSSSSLTYKGNTIWHSGNDGSGSGLDADTLDGQHASAFLTSLPSHNHDADYVNVSGDTMTGNLDVNADIKANTFTQEASGIPRSNLGSPTVTEMALFDSQFVPKTTLANDYNDLSDLEFYVQATSSSAWTLQSVSDDNKRRFLRTNNSGVVIPNGSYKYRIEFNAKGYNYANALYMYWSSDSHSTTVHIWKQRSDNDSWYQHTSSSTTVSSWPGHLWLPFSTIPWHETASTTTHYHKIRVEFEPTWSTGAYSDRTIKLYGGQIWGGYPSGRRTPHYYDQNGKLNTWGNLGVNGDMEVNLSSGANLNIGTIANGTIDFKNASSSSTAPFITGKGASGFAIATAVPDSLSNPDMTFATFESDGTDFATTDSKAFSFNRASTELMTIKRNGDVNMTGELLVNSNAVWHAGNDGSGSGLDADLLDGQHGSYFLNTSSTSQTKSGDLTVDQLYTSNNGAGTNVKIGDDAWLGDINVANTIRISGSQDSTKGYITFGTSSNDALGRSGTGALTWAGNTVWHSGNDGSGSGLDADLLDGVHGGSFLRSDTADTFSGDLSNGTSGAAISLGYDVSSINDTIGTSNWFRSSGGSGWYNGTHGGGIHMTDSTWVRVYNNKKFYVNNGAFFNGNVGIGITSPSSKLSVNGTTQLAGEVSLPSTGTATVTTNYPSQTLRFTTSAWDTNNSVARAVHWNIRNEGTSTIYPDGTLTFYEELPSYNHWKLKLPGRGSGSSYIHPDAALFNGRINVYESDTSNLNVSIHPSGNSYFNGGNVGIGTTSPAEKLDVVGGSLKVSDTYATAKIIGTGGLSRVFLGDTANEDVGYLEYNHTSNYFRIGVNAVERMCIASNGNVGIGKTNPLAKLDVNGNFRINTSNLSLSNTPSWGVPTQNIIGADDNTNGATLTLMNTSTTIPAGGVSGTLQFVALDDARSSGGSGYAIATISALSTSAPGTGNGGGGNLIFKTAAHYANVAERMRIDSSGNVGIGTTSPSQRLHVAGKLLVDNGDLGSTSGDSIYHAEITGARHHLDFKEIRTADGSDWNNTTYKLQMRVDSTNHQSIDFVSDASYSEHIDIYTGNQNFNTRFDANGNVGIGTTSPNDKLHVDGTIRAVSPGTSDWALLGLNNLNTAASGVWFDNGDGELLLRNNADNLKIRLRSDADSYIDGKIRIGSTTNPSNALDVSGNIGASKIILLTAGTSGAGAVTTPAGKLDIRSDSAWSNSAIIAPETTNQNPVLAFYRPTGSAQTVYPWHFEANGSSLHIKTGSAANIGSESVSAKVTINSSGNVGIGANNPGAKLEVRQDANNGNTGAFTNTHVKLTASATADNTGFVGITAATSTADNYGYSFGAQRTSGGVGDFKINYHNNSAAGTNRFIIDQSGNVGIGTTSNQSGYKLNVNGDIGASTGSQLYMYQNGGTGSTNAVIRVVNLDTSNYGQTTPNIYSDSGFYYGNRHCEFATNGTVRGYIGHNGSTTVTYSTTSSDERLKKNIEPWDEDTLNKFRNIQPKKFNFVDQEDTDPKDKGYIAQNMVDSFPEAYPHDFSISQTEGMYSFNPSGMVVYLMKAVKDLIAENDNLKARVEALENA